MRISDEAILKIEEDDNIEFRPQYNNVPVFVNEHDSYKVPSYQDTNPNTPAKAPYIPSHRIVHFDLKGAPPTMDYMKKVVRLSKQLGATGVLIEYEDMFPWTGRYKVVAIFKVSLSPCHLSKYIMIISKVSSPPAWPGAASPR